MSSALEWIERLIREHPQMAHAFNTDELHKMRMKEARVSVDTGTGKRTNLNVLDADGAVHSVAIDKDTRRVWFKGREVYAR